ncbi:hypothetical protein N7449_011681 [Penicillium cf. viridicatum]|uniref:Uncharacterized protein n=1 Tax=Penicillium cf. viridicatum TaxID=2972119 RepID=A0A9W9IPA0_9EURO|nr:hypothetical protein N7449_011681 [Penicillium cf. viridicatum]
MMPRTTIFAHCLVYRNLSVGRILHNLSGLLHPEADFRNQVDLAGIIDHACFMKAIGPIKDGSKPWDIVDASRFDICRSLAIH